MKAKKIITSALVLTMLFGTGVSTVTTGTKTGGGAVITAQAEDFGSVVIKDGQKFENDKNACCEREIVNEDRDSVYDGESGIHQWTITLFGYVQTFDMHGAYKVHDKVNDKYYWGYTSVRNLGDDPDISNFTDKKGILYEIPEGETRIPAGLLVTYYQKHTNSSAETPDSYTEVLKTRLYFGGKVVRFENVVVDGKNTDDLSVVYETTDKTLVLPECDLEAPEEGMVFGGWKIGNKVYGEGEIIKLDDRLTNIIPVWGKPEAAEKVNITLTAPTVGAQLSDKAKTDLNDIRLFVTRTTNVEVRDEDGVHYDPTSKCFEKTVNWSVDGEDLPTDRSSGALDSYNAEKGKKYTAYFYLQGNDKLKMTADTQVLVNGKKATVTEEKGKRNTFRCEVEFKAEEPKVEEPKPEKIVKGDVNNDGKIDVEDAVMVIGHVNGQKALSDDESKRANVDGSKSVDIEDAVAIIAHVNGVKTIE